MGFSIANQGRRGVRAGDPMDPNTSLAPLSSQSAADDRKDIIRQAVAHGAKATQVGPSVPNRGVFVQPTSPISERTMLPAIGNFRPCLDDFPRER